MRSGYQIVFDRIIPAARLANEVGDQCLQLSSKLSFAQCRLAFINVVGIALEIGWNIFFLLSQKNCLSNESVPNSQFVEHVCIPARQISNDQICQRQVVNNI